MNKVLILGGGPSGLMSAHAASDAGFKIVAILDKDPDKSRRNSGVFYLHSPCNLLLDSVEIKQTILGAEGKTESEIAKEYGLKVYGKEIQKVSVLDALKNKTVIGYNSVQALDRLWDLYGRFVVKQEVSYKDINVFLRSRKVISTIPANILFPERKLDYQTCWMRVGKAPENEAFVFYSISPNHKWYRSSAVFGTFVQEYMTKEDADKEGYQIHPVIKVTGKNSPKSTEDILFVGRFGAWDKTHLTHVVYQKVLEWLKP